MKIIPVIVPIYNRLETSKIGLNCIYEAILFAEKSLDVQFPLIVVDDGSRDGSADWVKNSLPSAHLIIGNGDWWWTGSVNRGLKYAIAEFKDNLFGFILQNDDVIVQPDWLVNLYNVVVNNPKTLVGCAAVDINNPDIIMYGGKKIHPWHAKTSFINLGKHLSEVPGNHSNESSDLIGRGIFIPNQVIQKIGVFDERHFKHRGDTELPVRAKKAGYKLLVTYNALVHINPETTSEIDIKKRYTLKDFKSKFFDFRSSSYWKYRYYYTKYESDNFIQHMCFFVLDMGRHFMNYVARV